MSNNEIALMEPMTGAVGELDPKLNGVRGWLALLCASLLVFGPLSAVISGVSATTVLRAYERAFGLVPGLQTMMTLEATLGVIVTLLGLAAGVQLIRRQRRALRLVAAFLAAQICLSVVFAFLPSLFGLPDEWKDALIKEAPMSIGRASIAAVIWGSYLRKSKRVLATYGTNL
jgi:hypothetical protein